MREKIVELLKNTKERIIGQDKYANSAVLIAIAEFNKKEYIILEKRAVEIRQGGEISLPGGRCDEKDKNSKETAIRETIEELGIPKEK
ncbi:putative NUDIX hydrolase [Fusobacterium varium]|nr:NUDIX domain-containing protein [Fusobacterium varium]VEH40016.1 putative NUDIX hydrolase [Fusobacterium varium]